jgi:Cupin domain
MKNSQGMPHSPRHFTRRQTLMLGASSYAAGLIVPTASARADTAVSPAASAAFSKGSETGAMSQLTSLHAGKGSVGIKRFPFQGAPAPAHFIVYEIPPGASEGVHVHHLDNRNQEGAFDEYYYIVSGEGQMQVDGELVPVKAGDHVHTPLDVAHGIENTHSQHVLKVFLTFINRAA